MAKRKKEIRAGQLVYAVAYTAACPSDSPHVRREKQKCSTAARKQINLRRAWQKLELVLAANFDRQDFHVVLTYREDALPNGREAAVRWVRRFLRQMREHRKKQGQATRYLYVTEGLHGGKRLHHHLILNSAQNDAEAIRSLWQWGDVHMERLDDDNYEAIARYLTKEPAARGTSNGKRCWTPSLNLKKPQVTSGWVADDLTLSPPPGAVVLDSDSRRNEFGEFAFLKYRLPKPEKRKTDPARLLGLKPGITSDQAWRKWKIPLDNSGEIGYYL